MRCPVDRNDNSSLHDLLQAKHHRVRLWHATKEVYMDLTDNTQYTNPIHLFPGNQSIRLVALHTDLLSMGAFVLVLLSHKQACSVEEQRKHNHRLRKIGRTWPSMWHFTACKLQQLLEGLLKMTAVGTRMHQLCLPRVHSLTSS